MIVNLREIISISPSIHSPTLEITISYLLPFLKSPST